MHTPRGGPRHRGSLRAVGDRMSLPTAAHQAHSQLQLRFPWYLWLIMPPPRHLGRAGGGAHQHVPRKMTLKQVRPTSELLHVLYVDFDNVLHGDVLRFRTPPTLRPETHGQTLFENAPILEILLEPYPDLKIVLSTSWVRELGFTRVQEAPRKLAAAGHRRDFSRSLHAQR
jgi:hypothetical protein